MAPRTRLARSTKSSKENVVPESQTKVKNAKITKSQRRPLADKTNSASDENASVEKIVTGKLPKIVSPTRPRRDRRVPSRFKENEVFKNLANQSHTSLSKTIGTKIPTPRKDMDCSLVAKRPKRIHRLPSRFEDYSNSPSKVTLVQPIQASTPIIKEDHTTTQRVTRKGTVKTKTVVPKDKSKICQNTSLKFLETSNNSHKQTEEKLPSYKPRILETSNKPQRQTEETLPLNKQLITRNKSNKIQSNNAAVNKKNLSYRNYDNKNESQKENKENLRQTEETLPLNKQLITRNKSNKIQTNNAAVNNKSKKNLSCRNYDNKNESQKENKENLRQTEETLPLNKQLITRNKSNKIQTNNAAVNNKSKKNLSCRNYDNKNESQKENKENLRQTEETLPLNKQLITRNKSNKIQTNNAAVNNKSKKNLSCRNYDNKNESQKENKENLAVYEFTYDPNEEPPPQKKKRKRTNKKKPAAKPKLYFYNNNYEKNLSKTLETLKSKVFQKSKRVLQEHTNITTGEEPINNKLLNTQNKPITVPTNLDRVTECNINYSPVTSPRPQISGEQTPWPQSLGEQTPRPQSLGEQTPRPQTPGEQILGPQTPGEQTFRQQTIGEKTPGPQTPDQQTLGQQISRQQTPWSQTSGQQTPGQQTPRHQAVGEQTPRPQTPDQQTLGQQISRQQTPWSQTSGQQAAGEQTPGQQTPRLQALTGSITDPLNLQGDSFFDEPIACSSFNTSAKHSLATPWRFEADLPLKFPINMYVKPNMTPAFDSSFINEPENPGKKHVYTNILSDTETREVQVNEPPKLVQTGMISFVREMVQRNIKKKRKSDTPTKNDSGSDDSFKLDIPDNGDKNDDQSVHLFEDVELVHHLKPNRKSYGKTKKVAANQQPSRSEVESLDDVDNTDAAPDLDKDYEDHTFKIPTVKVKKVAQKTRKRKAPKLSKKEEEEVDAWAADFNSMCEDVDGFSLVVE